MNKVSFYKKALSVVMSGFILVGLASCKKQKEENETTKYIEPTSISFHDIDLGEENGNSNKKVYVVSGNIDPNSLVRGNDGTLYVDENAASKAENIGKETIDDNNGQYVVVVDENTGEIKVYDSTPAIGILDKDSDIIEIISEIPSEYHTVEGSKDLLPNGYDQVKEDITGSDGSVVFEKGDVIPEGRDKDLENDAKKTEPTVIVETSSPYDLIKYFMGEPYTYSYEDASNIVAGNYDGIGKTHSESYTEVTTVIPTTEPTTVLEVTEPTTITSSHTDYYIDPDSGLIFESKADCDQCKLNEFEGYSLVIRGGVEIFVANNKEMDDTKQKSLGGK